MAETRRKAKTTKPSPPPAFDQPVWRFIDYHARWGSGGEQIEVPKFVKWYINGWAGCEGDVVSALAQLRADPDFIWLQGALVELLCRATNTSPKLQGYILTGNHLPASVADVGRILRMRGRGNVAKARGVLHKLAYAGFLECINPTRSPSESEGGRKKSSHNAISPKMRGSPKRKGAKQAQKPGPAAQKPAAVLKGEGECLLAQAKRKGKGKELPRDLPGARRAALIAQFKEMQDNPERAEVARAPTTSTSSDEVAATTASSDESLRAQVPAPGRMPAGPSLARPIGEVIALSRHRYSGAAWQFADDVLIRSGFFTAADVDAVRRGGGRFKADTECERAHWAKYYCDAEGEFSSDSMDWLCRSLFKRADSVRARRGDWANPEAYLTKAWQNLLKDLKRKRGKAGVG